MSAIEAGAEPVTHQRVLVVFSGLVLAMLLAALDSTIVATALPTIVGELGGLAHLSWVVTAYLLAQTVVTPLYGKLGDLYGRKVVLQVGIVVFLIGSALCGMSRSMTQLILFRAIQGLGGGGLMVTTQAVVADVVPPRERGRYQGIFGAVFGVSAIAGPLLGGYFTTHWTWRWIFYINLPLGLVALLVLAATLPPRSARKGHRLDYLGAVLLAVTLSAVILATDLGGAVYPWASAPILGLGAAAVVSLVAFLAVERRAAEPVLPLRLFREPTFAAASMLGFIVGFALFGAVTYLPLFLQVVNHASPTSSGLQMVPMMAGMLATSIASGQIISRTGRYRMFPVTGMATMAVGLFLLSRMTAHTPRPIALGFILVVGLGLGLVMQVLVIAVQNAVEHAEVGVATSGTALFRLIGGSLGTAALGAVFASRLARAEAAGVAHEAAFVSALSFVFLVAMAIALVGFVIAWMLPEKPLRATVAASAGDLATELGESFPRPESQESLETLKQGLAALADRDVRRAHIDRIVSGAGLTLSPAAAWLLLRLGQDPRLDPPTLGHEYGVDEGDMRAADVELQAAGLVSLSGGARTLSPAGDEAHAKIAAARRAHLAELFADWPADRHEELAAILRRFVRDLVPERSSRETEGA